MAKDNRPRQRMLTPMGVAQYPRLHRPDDRWGDPKYTINLIMDEEDAKVQKFARDLRQAYEDAYKFECTQKRKGKPKKATFPLKPLLDDEGDPVPGKLVLKLSMKAHVETKSGKEWDQRPDIVDAKKRPWPPKGPMIGGGSKVKCILDAVSYQSPQNGAGISCRLVAVQVVDLVEYVPSKSGMFEEEDGYEIGSESSDDEPEFEEEGTPEEEEDDGEGDY